MAKVFALIALILLSGFTGGSDVFATTHATRVALQAALTASAVDDTGGTDDDGQSRTYIAHTAMETTEGECCTDSTCANVNHCHHSGLSAMIMSHMSGMVSMLGGGYGLPRHDIPTQKLAESISKPPRA